jgi:threonylcarbamoyladenosine tRNA methylthiotransferase MtaB
MENGKRQTANGLFRILTFGCKVNQCDSAGLAGEFVSRGWRPAPPGTVPNLALINTCTVTARADQQARQAIRRLAREFPGTPLWVTGCYAQRAGAELLALPGVQAVWGNPDKGALAQHLTGFPLSGPLIQVRAYAEGEPFRAWPGHPLAGHTRASLKIQEGCENNCGYCIVPRVRGPRRSMEPAAVAAACRDLAAAGYQEVVLTGVNLGQYGRDLQPPVELAGLLRRLQAQPHPARLRLSSLEPQEVTPELLQAAAALPGFCPHFHLPLQSGSAEVLAAMGRPYLPQDFADLVRELRGRFPAAALGLDILVGFPGESAAAFEAARSFLESLPLSYLHVFPFSPRPGTPAAILPRVPQAEVQRRAGNLRALGQRKKRQFLESQAGQIREVLVEGTAASNGWLQGLSDNYLRVLLPGSATWHNRRLMVRFLKQQGEMMVGEAA